MKKIHVFILAGLVFAFSCRMLEAAKMPDNSPKGNQSDRKFSKTVTKTLSIDYLLYLPKDYEKTPQKWPLMIFLHGAGERGNDLRKVEVHGPPKIVKDKDLPFIILSPQCPQDSWWPKMNEVLIALLDYIVDKYHVDTTRIYLTGLSMGGFGTWSLASDYPDRFAAIVPICGGGEPFFAYKLKNTPVWAFHGGKDNVVPTKNSEDMVNAVNRSGGSAKLTVYPEAGHDSWTETYNNPELYDWFLKYKKPK
jgi:predicted peptidase